WGCLVLSPEYHVGRGRPQVNRGINATTSAKMKELLRFIPFFVAYDCLFFLGRHKKFLYSVNGQVEKLMI
ncbi:hypothetical protein, partial [Salmonella enterica]|uniref:hypothetical protein n=1 Tax=Salmonella enterica TaxID=28901 RepID=UPI00329A6B8D